MKYKFYLVAATVLMLILCGCGSLGKSDIKSVKVSNFTDLIFDDGVFVPNTEFAWNMSEDDFLSKVYGADRMDPDSENFDEYRYSNSEETNITTFTPPVSYRIDPVPTEVEAAYAFNESGLFKAGYVWTFKENETDKAEQTIAALIKDVSSNENIMDGQFEAPALSDMDTDDFPYTCKWTIADLPQGYVEMAVLKIKEHTVVQLTAGIS